MADILYIDCNRSNSIKSDENTNEWEFKLQDEALMLPAGTQVSIQESFINKRGVGGSTIVIDDDITTTIRYGYYITHSPHFAPNSQSRPFQGSYQLFTKTIRDVGAGGGGGDYATFKRDWDNSRVNPPARDYFGVKRMEDIGGTELPLCAVKITKYAEDRGLYRQTWAGDNGTISPHVAETEISIPAGSYAVEEIAKLIEDQLNGKLVNVKNKDFTTDFIRKKKTEGTYRGTLENDGTLTMSNCFPQSFGGSSGNYRNDRMTLNYWRQFDPTTAPAGFPVFRTPFYRMSRTAHPNNGELDSVEDRWQPLFFMKPSDWNDCRETHIRINEWNNGQFRDDGQAVNKNSVPPIPPDPDKIDGYIKRSSNWDYRKQTTFLGNTGGGTLDPTNQTNFKPLFHLMRNVDFKTGNNASSYNYDPQYKGVYVGAPEITFNWNTESSAFEINNLHFPYRFMSHDPYGNPLPEAGLEGVLTKRLNDERAIVKQNPPPDNEQDGTRVSQSVMTNIESPQERIGGIFIMNWAVEVAETEGDINKKDGTQFSQQDLPQGLWNWDEHFSSKEKSRDAWKKTLWHKLGFSYDALQNPDNFEMCNYIGEDTTNRERLGGATTKADFNPSIISTISSAFNINQFKPNPDLEDARPRVYSNFDVGTVYANQSDSSSKNPFPQADPAGGTIPFNNNGGYTSSPYQSVTCVPVQTQGKAITASALPTLSEQGYYLITSNIIDGYKDRIKRGTPISLLGVVPISNLSSQDFIQTRNEIVHTIQNPVVLNSIKIKVLKPDLTAPSLEENSSVILKIVRPLTIPNHIGDIDKRPENDKVADNKNKIVENKVEQTNKNIVV